MMVFAGLAALMLVVAVALLAPPLLRGRLRASEVAGRDLRRVYRERLAELQAERDRGTLSEAGFEEARDELEREVLEDADRAQEPETVEAAGPARVTAAVLAVAVPAIAIGTYVATGRPELLGGGSADRLSSQQAQRFGQMAPAQRIPALEDYVERHPDAPRAWTLLGQAYRAQEQYGAAYDAFGQALDAGDGRDAWLTARRAEALLLANGRQFTAGVDRLIDEALELQPRNPLALMLAGHSDLADGKSDEAVRHWELLLDSMPEGDRSRQAVERMIAQVEGGGSDRAAEGAGMRSGSGGAQASSGTADSSADARVTVQVRLDDALRDAAPPGTPVFVFARSADGSGGPPLAVARTTVGALPTEIALTDAQAMTPNGRISQAERVVVFARASLSGGVTPQPGDLQGRSGAVPVSDSSRTTVTIASRVGDSGSGTGASGGTDGDAAAAAGSDTDRSASSGDAGPGVTVEVRIADELRDAASDDAPVFVFAREAGGGGGPPLAVARINAGQLPARLTLTDEEAMTSSRRISQASRVVLTARVSQGGDVMPQPGDLEGSSEPVDVGGRARITIDRRIE